jgi:hypothetical protein
MRQMMPTQSTLRSQSMPQKLQMQPLPMQPIEFVRLQSVDSVAAT